MACKMRGCMSEVDAISTADSLTTSDVDGGEPAQPTENVTAARSDLDRTLCICVALPDVLCRIVDCGGRGCPYRRFSPGTVQLGQRWTRHSIPTRSPREPDGGDADRRVRGNVNVVGGAHAISGEPVHRASAHSEAGGKPMRYRFTVAALAALAVVVFAPPHCPRAAARRRGASFALGYAQYLDVPSDCCPAVRLDHARGRAQRQSRQARVWARRPEAGGSTDAVSGSA